MRFRFELSDKEEVVVYAREKNHLVNMIESLCNSEYKLIGYQNDLIKELNSLDVDCFFTEEENVFALVGSVKYKIKKRLYELNDICKDSFIYINQSCLVNVNSIDCFDASISGALKVILKNGYKDYVSRRQVKNVKERIGLK